MLGGAVPPGIEPLHKRAMLLQQKQGQHQASAELLTFVVMLFETRPVTGVTYVVGADTGPLPLADSVEVVGPKAVARVTPKAKPPAKAKKEHWSTVKKRERDAAAAKAAEVPVEV